MTRIIRIIRSDERPRAVGEAEMLDPVEHRPPTGVQLLLITIGGTLVQGHWTDDGRYTHWCPLPRVPKKEDQP